MKKNDVASLLLIVYLGLSPVYWLPGIPISLLNLFKQIILVLSFLLVWIDSSKRLKIPTGLVGLVGFLIIIVLGSSGFFQSNSEYSIRTFFDFLYPFIFSWTIYNIYIQGRNLNQIFRFSAIIISILCLPLIMNWFLQFPTWSSPAENGFRPLWNTGFGLRSTGWSNAISLFFPIILISTFNTRKQKFLFQLTNLLCLLVIIGSQLITGGRAGLTASLFSLFIFFFFIYKKNQKFKKAIAVVTITCSIVVFSVISADFLNEHLRIDRLVGQSYNFDTLNEFSSGRLIQYREAIALIKERPFFGHGYGTVGQVHNLWLRYWSDAGIVFVTWIVIIFVSLCFNIIVNYKAIRNRLNDTQHIHYEEDNLFLTSSLIFINGLTMSFFEPNVPFGAFQNSAIFWAAIGILIGKKYKDRRNI